MKYLLCALLFLTACESQEVITAKHGGEVRTIDLSSLPWQEIEGKDHPVRVLDLRYFNIDTDACMGTETGWVECCGNEWYIPQMCNGASVTCVDQTIVITCPNPNCPPIEYVCGHGS